MKSTMKVAKLLFLVIFFSFMSNQTPAVLDASSNVNSAEDSITVQVNNEWVEFDHPPIIVNNRTLVPIRAVLEKIGATVNWNHETQKIIIIKDDLTLELMIDYPYLETNILEESFIPLDVSPTLHEQRTLLPLRHIMEAIGAEVHWDEEEKIISITYEEFVYLVNHYDTSQTGISNYARVSNLQQFSYKDKGIAYGYLKDNRLHIHTPENTLVFSQKYPLLGDIISDDEGYLYVIWGSANETSNKQAHTTFITKYSPSGKEIKTNGFEGYSSPWNGSEDANTQLPFRAGNSVSIIHEDKLLNYHAKKRYDGHQSDGLIGVDINTMNALDLPETTFSGHSFNQDLIFSEKINDFLFASHGDAYARGFMVNDSTSSYGDDNNVTFHFYLEPNANYDMWIVNKTFAQLGGIVETQSGVVLVGASAKSISEQAKTEKQNLFIQLFDPSIESNSPEKFLGGTRRTGATSFDINDNNNSPLTPVTDYGVRWLTNYTDTDVITPQVVLADDKIVILWSTSTDSYYMVLSSNGDIITEATSLNNASLNSYEKPIYYNGGVHWVEVSKGILRKHTINID